MRSMHRSAGLFAAAARHGFPLERLFGPVLALMLALATLLAVSAGAAAPADYAPPATPQATIGTVTADALAVLRTNKHVAVSKDASGVAAQIAAIVDPYLDFTIMSEEVLGVGWRRADAQQRTRFIKVFKQLLTDDYAAVFNQYNGQTIKVMDSRWDDAAHDRATVTSRLESPGAQPVEVDYRLFHTGGRWKVYDVVVEGVSLLVNYREEFADELQHESLDALIARLEDKVSAIASHVSQ
jgi:phospholipid transport system substrate-binding protein